MIVHFGKNKQMSTKNESNAFLNVKKYNILFLPHIESQKKLEIEYSEKDN